MKVFTLNEGNLYPASHSPFELERDIQEIVENNLQTIFGLTFIQSELRVNNYRIDTLGFDDEKNSFVILEYKKGNSYSVIDQGYTYLQLLLNNKSDFLLSVSQHYGKVMSYPDVDWSQSRIIFIAPKFNGYQKDSVNFKDIPFELWEIRRFNGGPIIFSKQESTSHESINSLTAQHKKSVIQDVSKEVRVPTIEDHLSKTSEDMQEKWEELQTKLNVGGIEFENVPVVKEINIKIDVNGKSKVLCYNYFGRDFINIGILSTNFNVNGKFNILEDKYDKDDPRHFFQIKMRRDTNIDDVYEILRQKYWQLKNAV